MKKDYCELHFISEPSKVRGVVRCLLEFMDIHRLSPNIRDDLRLVFSELLYNAIFHGNKNDGGKGVYVRVEVTSEYLYACIRDEGTGFDYKRALEDAKSDLSLHKEDGRGMVLVTALTDRLFYNESGNQILFEKKLG